jgi:diguanylate cyclase (GGDEF)-like protein
MNSRSPRIIYPVVGVLLGILVPIGAFVIRYAFIPDVHASPRIDLDVHGFFYLYELVGSCGLFAVAGWIAGIRAEQLREAESFYHALSEHDSLTGLFNARAFRNRYGRLLERAARTGSPLSLLLIDVDQLKMVNDMYGHAVGNKVLMHVATALREAKRAEDSAARWGGDEFAILLEGADGDAAKRVAENVLERVKLKTAPYTRGVNVTVTVGACTAMHLTPESDLFTAADRALYQGKSEGRDRLIAVTI